MARKDGRSANRVVVAVSDAMVRLRGMQGALNGFWQTSDLACRYLLSHGDALAQKPMRPTYDVLGHIESEVWFPSNQGGIKRTDTIRRTLIQVERNAVHAYRATLLSFYAAFEDYLDSRAGPVLTGVKKWGPFVQSLRRLPVAEGARAPRLRTIACADLCRLIRNRMVHSNFAVPTTIAEVEALGWEGTLLAQCREAGWPEAGSADTVRAAVRQVIGQARRQVDDAAANGKDLAIEYFYMLFTFTNLDSLAFAVEEALIPAGHVPRGRVMRRADAVRRRDLIVDVPPRRD